jgi:DNA modification methylase
MTAIVLRGDARDLPLPDSSVDLIVTSPPFYGLRDYQDGGQSLAGQIGSEKTPRAYVDSLLSCTREWMRALKPEGSIFVNLGDSYYSGKGAPGKTTTDPKNAGRDARRTIRSPLDYGLDLPRKTLIGLPWRYALGCMDDLGLILRAEIIWAKPNGLPESVTDRVRRSHEQWFHFTRLPRYYSAVDEIREPHSRNWTAGANGGRSGWDRGDPLNAGLAEAAAHPFGKLPGSVWDIPSQPLTVPECLAVDHFAAFPMELPRRIILGWSPAGICAECGEGRRPVPTAVALDMTRPQARRAQQLADQAGLTEAHARALLSVGISDTGRGAATQNGTGKNTAEVYTLASEARQVLGGYAREYLLRRPTSLAYACACTPYTDHPGRAPTLARREDFAPGVRPPHEYGRHQAGEYERFGPSRQYHLNDWTPPPARPAVVLDPLGGTGTTALVADVLGRTGISLDRSADYCRLARWRTTDSGERAKAMQVPKPPPVPDGQMDLFGEAAS